MTVDELIITLARRGIELKAEGDRISFRPRSRITPDLAEAVRVHVDALLAALAGPDGPCSECKSAIFVRTRVGPVVCPGCCPVSLEAVAEKLIWIDDPPGLADFHAELAKCQQDRKTVNGSLSAGVWDWVEGQLWALPAEDREPVPPPYRLVGCGFESVRSPRPAAPMPDKCPHCGRGEHTDVVIHGGESTRRDCAQCGRTWGFARWHDGSAQGDDPRVSQESADGMEPT